MQQVHRVALAARVFTLAALAATAAVLGGHSAQGIGLVAIAVAFAQTASLANIGAEWQVAVAEGATVALLAVLEAPGNDAVVPYLAIPVLIGGLSLRLRGVVRVVLAEAIVLVTGFAAYAEALTRQEAARDLMWLVTGLGLGLLGASIHRLLAESASQSSYRSAVELIKQLHDLSGQLSDGLDAGTIADNVLALAAEEVPLRQAGLFARTDGAFAPLALAAGTQLADLVPALAAADTAWSTRAPRTADRSMVVPLCHESHVVVLLVAQCLRPAAAEDLDALMARLAPETLKLYAALLFAQVRDSATQEERLRLAREVHDGVAQDVASLGYLLDAVPALDPDQVAQLGALRAEITRVVAELRRSVYDLRTDTVGRGLGQSLTTLAQRIAARSSMAVHVTLDEAATRLRPQVESELLRIAQEAMNNARTHSGGANLWLSCRVRPPYAEIVVRDDGGGLGQPREDSHGLQIMRERAASIGAELDVSELGSGTQVRVQVTGGESVAAMAARTGTAEPRGRLRGSAAMQGGHR